MSEKNTRFSRILEAARQLADELQDASGKAGPHIIIEFTDPVDYEVFMQKTGPHIGSDGVSVINDKIMQWWCNGIESRLSMKTRPVTVLERLE